jgi:hypothetical protein
MKFSYHLVHVAVNINFSVFGSVCTCLYTLLYHLWQEGKEWQENDYSPGHDDGIIDSIIRIPDQPRFSRKKGISSEPHIAYLFPCGAQINEMTVNGAGFATNGELYTLSRTMRA